MALKPNHDVFDGLTEQQARAVSATRGPVCIHAGAGTGKTSTITRRIAHQILSGAFDASQLLAVTFTDKAATEMRARLSRLGVTAVRAKTFHAEALAQITAFEGRQNILASKAELLAPISNSLPKAFRFRPLRDLAGEIERAKNSLVAPPQYIGSLDGRTPPLPPDMMAGVYFTYEARKRKAGLLDFEDVLARAAALIADVPEFQERARTRYASFTVDEYQDVNPLQQQLLDVWLGDSDEVCVVGDERQSIYGFTAASSHWLTSFSARYPSAVSISLTTNFRSTSQVLKLANRLAQEMDNDDSNPLQAASEEAPDGEPSRTPEPEIVTAQSEAQEVEKVVAKIVQLIGDGTPPHEIAILYRINARSEVWEKALSKASIPTNVRGGGFAQRLRAVVQRAQKLDPAAPARMSIESIVRAMGWRPDADPQTEEEQSRIEDLTQLVNLADETTPLGVFLEGLETLSSSAGVVLSTLHRAKGLEFDAVFVPRLEERELPFGTRKNSDIEEERRLLYVGITRARKHLMLSWSIERDGKPTTRSRFLTELLPGGDPERKVSNRASHPSNGHRNTETFEKLRAWRTKTAKEQKVAPFIVFHDKTLDSISTVRPRTMEQLASVSGVGPNKLLNYGAEVLSLLND